MRIYPVFLSHAGCPQRCVFCNQHAAEKVKPWQQSVEESIAYIEKSNLVYDEVAFYGGTPTSSLSFISDLLEPFQPFIEANKVRGIRLSTRPDELDKTVVAALVDYHVTTVELGVESFSDEVLDACGRGYHRSDVLSAYELVKPHFNVVLQIMVGLPKETEEDRRFAIEYTVDLHPWGVRYFPTLVLRNTVLEKMYKDGYYKPLSMDEAIHWSKTAYNSFKNAGIRVLQVGLHSSEFLTDELVAGPYVGNFGELVRSDF
ncbi:radical SAM protein [Coprothermobacter platensis]|uniref:radical SAM protein n=1 Tax=Coprothermobacter platensis TaxID=108819 RepID=UPI0003692CB9|nr:radical SAM protein [Coprothermobacter platensis]